MTGRAWRLREADVAVVRSHRLRHALLEPVAQAIAARGVSEDEVADWLDPTMRALFPEPATFKGMSRVVEILLDAVQAGRRCIVFADYDVDGATSAALLVRWFRAVGHDLEIYVPDRLIEGYGPSAAAFRSLQAKGADLVVTVDCGAAAHDALEAAAEIALPVVVIDHHLMRGAPPAAGLINPNQPGCESGQGGLAAAGVVLVLLAALNREARRRGWFERRAAPDLMSWLDLAALGAICDVTPLTGFNRAIASQGLRVMSRWGNPGLKALFEVAQASGVPTSFHAGFVLGPRINAGGRIGRSDLGARLLATDDPDVARQLAEELDRLNVERRAVEDAVTTAATVAAERQIASDAAAPVIVVAAEGWHPGVVGIVASRLRERLRRPVVVIGIDGATGVGKGSGRSHPGVNLGRAVQAAFESGVLMAGGGHAMAAGMTLRAESVPEFREFLGRELAHEIALAEGHDDIEVDALVAPAAVTRALLSAFEALHPHGRGNPEPVFALAGVRIASVRALRGGHVSVVLEGDDGARVRGMAWRAADSPLGARLLAQHGLVHVVGVFKKDDWNGREGVQIEIHDLADPRRFAPLRAEAVLAPIQPPGLYDPLSETVPSSIG